MKTYKFHFIGKDGLTWDTEGQEVGIHNGFFVVYNNGVENYYNTDYVNSVESLIIEE